MKLYLWISFNMLLFNRLAKVGQHLNFHWWGIYLFIMLHISVLYNILPTLHEIDG